MVTARLAIRLGLIAAVLYPALPRAQAPAGCTVGGTIASNRIALPGVVVSLVASDGHVADVSSSGVDGTFVLRAPLPGGYTLKAELVAFAPFSREVAIADAACQQRVDIALTLASRAAAVPAARLEHVEGRAETTAPVNARPTSSGRAGRGQARTQQPFQPLELLADQAGLARNPDQTGAESDAPAVVLPPGFSPDTSAESVTAVGTAQQNDLFLGPGGAADFAQRFGSFGGFDGGGAGQVGVPGGPGGPAGPGRAGGPGGFGGPGGGAFMIVRGRGNQVRGQVFQSVDTSALDAAPYALNGQPTTKPSYLQQRFGATLGGPLNVPKIVDSSRTFFFLNYTGNHSSNPYDAYSNVPTLAERAGDFSGTGLTIVDPATGQPFAGGQIPASRINAASQQLLSLIPTPNQAGSTRNFHNVTTVTSQLDDVNVRLIHLFGQPPQRGRGQGGGRGGFGRGGFGRAAGPGSSNLNVTVHYRHSDNTSANPFPTLGGQSTVNAFDVPGTYSFTKGGLFNALRFDVNRQHAESTNLFANAQDVAGGAGLLGVSTDPLDWGAPNLSFSQFSSLRDVSPSTRTDRTLSIGDTLTKTHGKHTFRFGGDLRSVHADSRSAPNARGSYVFTGLYSGSDFADFLLGFPQQASVQPGLPVNFSQTTGDLFAQDDWRITDKLTVNAGLRYEYYSPLEEVDNRLVTLDVPADFSAAVPVEAGGTGPFAGALPDTIVRPYRKGLAPRVGIAWRVRSDTVLRTGYSVNYNSNVYQSIAQQLANQPPFVQTATVIAPANAPLRIQTILQNAPPGTILNNYAVDPNYVLPNVQIWNLDLQRDLSRTVQIGIGYTGTKGSNLDLLEAPNRTATGLRIAGVAPFLYETSIASSQMNSLNLRIRKRLSGGLAFGANYTLSKSIDDASSIAGNGGTVAQNPDDLAAERGLSNFDQRHLFNANFTYELPFGAAKRWFPAGPAASLLGNWVVNGSVQLASGTPVTALVLGSATDVARGTNGTLRANYNGLPIAVADPSIAEFFDKSAFSLPAAGTYGNAGRNTIIGPGTSSVNFSVMKNINFSQTRGLSIQLVANNVFNTVQFAAVDPYVNSPTFGEVTAMRPMRRVQLLTRFRF